MAKPTPEIPSPPGEQRALLSSGEARYGGSLGKAPQTKLLGRFKSEPSPFIETSFQRFSYPPLSGTEDEILL